MTREEAIQVLQEKIDDRPLFKDEREAFELAIEALSQPIVCKDYCIDDDHIYCSPKVADRVVEALSTDAVSREALNGVKFVAIKGDKVEEAYRSGWNGAIECIIENAPSADRPIGEWIFNTDENNGKSWNICSVCGYSIFHTTNYCPSCGARMKGGAE